MTRAGNRNLLSGSHVSSMTGGCTYLIYYQGVVSLGNGSVTIRYKIPELIKSSALGGEPRSPAAMFQA